MSDEIVLAPVEPERGPESYPKDHPLRDPWHHDRCGTCGHKRVEHYDEGGVCVTCFDPEADQQPCERFERRIG